MIFSAEFYRDFWQSTITNLPFEFW